MTAAEIYKHAGMFFPPPPLPSLSADNVSMVEDRAGVYFMYQGDDVVYVGESVSLRKRLCTHEHKGQFDRVGVLLCDPHQRKRLECFYKGLLDPPLNNESTQSVLTKTNRRPSVRRKLDQMSVVARRMCEFIEQNPGASKTMIHRGVGWRKNASLCNDVLRRLVEWRFVRVSRVPTNGRTKLVYERNTAGQLHPVDIAG